MVIQHDDIQPEFSRSFYSRMVLATAVHGNEQATTSPRYILDSRLAKPVTLASQRQPDRDRLTSPTRGTECQCQQRGRRHAIGVVISKNANRLIPA